MLYPFVESCLPEELLRILERNNANDSDNQKEKLEELMLFIWVEVENKEKVVLTKRGVAMEKRLSRGVKGFPTTSSFVIRKEKKIFPCIFFNSDKQVTFQYNQNRKSILTKRVILYLCPGHTIKSCKE